MMPEPTGFAALANRYAGGDRSTALALLAVVRAAGENGTATFHDIAVRYRLEAFEDRDVEILTREPYTLEGEPVSVRVPYVGRFVGEHLVQRPLAYAVPGAIADRLEGHGLVVERPPVAPAMEPNCRYGTCRQQNG